jgi:protein-tyrosine phosphatase
MWILVCLVSWAGWGEPIPLEGTRNTRDLGGLPVRGGRLRSGQLIRSGALCFITPQDDARLQQLQVRSVIDLRAPEEIAKDGVDKLSGSAVRLNWPMRSYHGLGAESYRSMVLQNPLVLRKFFAHLAQQESYPVLFHCSAGKDRAGILTALLLDALGCPRETIVDDYLQSQRNSPRLRVEREWLQEVFDSVDLSGGSRAFLRIQGVSAGQLEAIGNYLTETDR